MRTRRWNKLWHDDVRRPPAGDPDWFWARTNREAVLRLLAAEAAGEPFVEASLDHDMGYHECDPDDPDSWRLAGDSPEGDGVDLAMAMYHLMIVPPKITIHSWNPDGAARMAGILREAGADVTVQAYRAPDMDDAHYQMMFAEWPG